VCLTVGGRGRAARPADVREGGDRGAARQRREGRVAVPSLGKEMIDARERRGTDQ